MYSINDYMHYQKPIIYTQKYPIKNIYYREGDLDNVMNQFEVPIESRNKNNFRPIYKMNSQNYLKEERIKIIQNNDNNYISNMPTNSRRNINFKNRILSENLLQPIPSITQANKYYYNDKVIVHKRSVNKNNYNNNSIHFIKSVSKNKKNENIIQGYNNRKIIYINNNKYNKNQNNKNYSNNDNMITNNINNYNIIKIEKKFVNKKGENLGFYDYSNDKKNINITNDRDNKPKFIQINNNSKYNYNTNINNINDNKNYVIEKYYKDNEIPNKNARYIEKENQENIVKKENQEKKGIKVTKENVINEKELTISIEDIKSSQISQKYDIQQLIKEKENLEKKLNEIINENNQLKKINLETEKLIKKNKNLSEKLIETEDKIKKLQIENNNYINEINNNNNIRIMTEKEITNINKRLRITYLKYLLEKKIIGEKMILKKYLLLFKEIAYQIRKIQNNDKNYKNLVNVI